MEKFFDYENLFRKCPGQRASGTLFRQTYRRNFPEITFLAEDTPAPFTEKELVALMPRLCGKSILTLSEIIILSFLREVRKGRLRTDEIELYSSGRRIQVDTKGEMIDYWSPEGFFETGFYLVFD